MEVGSRLDVHGQAVHGAPVHALEGGHVHARQRVGGAELRQRGLRRGLRRRHQRRGRRRRARQRVGRVAVRVRRRHRAHAAVHQPAPRPQHQPLAQRQRRRRHGLLGLRALALHLLVLDGVEVDVAHALHGLLRVEGDEAEAAVALGLLVHEHDGVLDEPELREVRAHLLGGGVLADAAHEDLLGLGGARRGLGRGVLGVDALPVQRVHGHGQHLVHGRRLLERDEAEAARPLRAATVSALLQLRDTTTRGNRPSTCSQYTTHVQIVNI